MRRSMASTLWRFSTTRMLHDYVEQMYLPVDEKAQAPTTGGAMGAQPPAEAEVVAKATEEVVGAADAARSIAGADEPDRTPVEK